MRNLELDYNEDEQTKVVNEAALGKKKFQR